MDPAGIVVIPNASAARLVHAQMAQRGVLTVPRCLGRDGLYDFLQATLPDPKPRLSVSDREALMRTCLRRAREEGDSTLAPEGPMQTMELRPGLIAEVLRLYDQLRRQRQSVGRFEELLEEALARDAEFDRGAARLLQQTRTLAAAFRAYEALTAESNVCDEHSLRDRLLRTEAPASVRAIVVTVADWIAEPGGLYVADFDLLARLPGLESIAVVATERILESGFHQRIHDWLPGIEETDLERQPLIKPRLEVPDDGSGRWWFTVRDREEELVAIARHARAVHPVSTAVVYKRPLPYLYLAREVFASAGLTFQTADAFPLATEPFSAALDLVLDLASSSFTRTAVVSLLRSPHFSFGAAALDRSAVSALDRALSTARYLGGLEQLTALAARWRADGKEPSALTPLDAVLPALDMLAPLRSPAPASDQVALLLSFIRNYATDEEPESRGWRARAAIVAALDGLLQASRSYDDAPLDVEGLAPLVKRAIEEQTFTIDWPSEQPQGIQLVDDQAARYGDFAELSIVGLIEGEWPDRPQRNIFYSSSLLQSLGWPSERDRQSAAEARFLDLLTSASERTSLSTVTLDDEALVEPSPLLDEVARAGLSAVARENTETPVFTDEALCADAMDRDSLPPEAHAWADLRAIRSERQDLIFHGQAGPVAARAWSVSALEAYLDCPFKFYAQRILRLEEEPDDEEVMDPRRQGEFIHAVFERFFRRWESDGRQAVTPENLSDARETFEEVVDESLGELSSAEAPLERTRLLGSSAAAGLGEAVLRMEAERPVAVVGRLLEHKLEGAFEIETNAGQRIVRLSGKADRIDLLEDGTFRVIDYKLGWPPNRARALQLPIYGLCAEQQLAKRDKRNWTLCEGVYLAFKGPKRVVGLFQPADRDRVLREAQQRLADAIDAIERGDFPPHPQDVYRCETCAFTAVCRKDYVGDV
jgi:RecB family exonuclease